MGKLNNFILKLKQKPFIQSIINDLNGEVLAVGGIVRDLILNKPNKDIDLIIRNVPIDTLISYLQKFGKVDVVGKSFGVIKFVDNDGIDYDIALPRTDKKNTEGGYRGFDVQSNENLPIEDDLIRRDAKMNAMAININTGKFIDPLGGLEDIKNKQISAANSEAFSDDPLRLLRMISFASRFGFTIEPETMKMIQDNASKIKEISPERILMEFDKIIKKSNILSAAVLLDETGLFAQIFGKPQYYDFRDTKQPFDKVKTMGEFIYLLGKGVVESPAEFHKNNLNGDINTYKEIKALEIAFDSGEVTNSIESRSVTHNMYLLSPQSLQSNILPNIIKDSAQELLEGKYPKTVNELAVNGDDLMKLGLQGKAIGDMQKTLLLKIYGDKVRNIKEDLLNLSLKKNELNEAKVKPLEKIEPFEFDPLTVTDPQWRVITNALTRIGYSSRPYTDWKKAFNDWGKRMIPDNHIDNEKTIILKKALTPRGPLSDTSKAFMKAKRYFGTTNNFIEAGYLLPDGSMLNFSGARFGGTPNRRDLDHREINIIGLNMMEFIGLGAIRLLGFGFELMQEPTRQQINVLGAFIETKNDIIIVDFAHKGNQYIEYTIEYPKNTIPIRIINDVIRYYQNGIKPTAPLIREKKEIN